MASTFGARLRRLREAKGFTLQQVADAAGCTKAYIWELEKKPGQKPSAARVQAIAKFLDVTMEDLMGEPVGNVTDATAEDLVFFRDYVGMSDKDKELYRDALALVFRARGDESK